MSLTEEGLKHIQEIGQRLFAYLALMRSVPVPDWVLEESQKLQEARTENRGGVGWGRVGWSGVGWVFCGWTNSEVHQTVRDTWMTIDWKTTKKE